MICHIVLKMKILFKKVALKIVKNDHVGWYHLIQKMKNVF